MIITDQLIDNWLNCKYKSYLVLNGEHGQKSEYELVNNRLYKIYRQKYLEQIKRCYRNDQITNSHLPIDIKAQSILKIIMNPEVKGNGFSLKFNAIEISDSGNARKKFKYIPIIITPKERISKKDKISLMVKTILLNQVTNHVVDVGKIIYSKELRKSSVKITDYKRNAQKVLDELNIFMKGNDRPMIFRSDNCRTCEFEERCRKYLIEKDDLSLLGGFSLNEIIKRNKKGLFTINSLSYNFRPKKFKKTRERGRPFSYELKALAIRDNKTYVFDLPEIKSSRIEIFIDFEGIPDEKFVYLIGVIIRGNELEETISLWADSNEQEQEIFEKLLKIVMRFDDYAVYHYGSYETKELKRVSNTYPDIGDSITTNILKNSVNLLSYVYSKVYTPTYTNSLKDIGSFLGFNWSAENSTGIQSIAWRKSWELSSEEKYKKILLNYNIEDCQALIVINDWLKKIRDGNTLRLDDQLSSVDDIKQESTYKFGKTEFLIPDFTVINNCAYFDYQREKVFIKINSRIKKIIKGKNVRQRNRKIKINNYIRISLPPKCPDCGNNRFYRHDKRKRLIIDLKFTNNGIKRWVSQYDTGRFKCRTCGRVFTPENFKKLNNHFGKNLYAWVINQNISYGMSLRNINQMLSDFFNIQATAGGLQRSKASFAFEYKDTYSELLNIIAKSNLLHVDETQVNFKKNIKESSSGYVWVFANIDTAYYLFKPNREADFLKEILKEFKGVLISDFYAGYDALTCSQQKCLIHLIRDLNDDLYKNPFDTEFKEIVTHFGKLLRAIIETIEVYGLKRRNLNKHKKAVKEFFEQVLNASYNSELAVQYQKRFRKNKDKLFTFMEYNNIPWNNNNAEHAIKHFAMHRRNVNGLFSKKSIGNYLILLSIYQTCKYRGLNFLHFLLSGEKSIPRFFNKAYRFNSSQ